METHPLVRQDYPRCVYIEVTNTCNLLCQTCPITFMDLETREVLSYDKFLAIVAQFPRIERAVLHGIGEPLLNKALPQMITYLPQATQRESRVVQLERDLTQIRVAAKPDRSAVG
jgi:MoaA/NifB/PqqE/SkfB family radical SAM enzyme